MMILLRYIIAILASLYLGISFPKNFVVVEKNVMVTMEDGILLAADVYRPKSKGKYPVILIRTPYDKTSKEHKYGTLASVFASQGYVCIVQDTRGKFRSEGKFTPYINEASDGNDTVEWAGKAPWSNGNVAVFGFSYSGTCAWLAATQGNPHLKTIIPAFVSKDTYAAWFDKGVPYLKDMLCWIAQNGTRERTKDYSDHIEKVISSLPVKDLDITISTHKFPAYRNFLENKKPNTFWENISANTSENALETPALIIEGWYDRFVQEGINDFSENNKNKLVIGPWGHIPTQKFEEADFGKEASFIKSLPTILPWCDYWLNDDKKTPPEYDVSYFVTGSNEWRTASRWPPENASFKKLSLSKSTTSDNILTEGASSKEFRNTFAYDPKNPMPSIGSDIIYGDDYIGPRKQDSLVLRDDVVVFASEPLEEDVTIAGPLKLVVHFSSSAPDTDIIAKISDKHPDGSSYHIQSGFIRTRHRDSLESPSFLEEGVVYAIEVPINSAAHTFKKGHSIQLLISSSDFPHHSRNLNTGADNEETSHYVSAKQTIFYGGDYDSHILLSVTSDQ
jgi:uncharacterized protein